MAVTVRVEDIAHGCPAGGVDVRVERHTGTTWDAVADLVTDDRGCLEASSWADGGGVFRLVIDVQRFYASLGLACSQAQVSTSLRVDDLAGDQHVSVLLAPSACTVHTGQTS